MTKIQRLRHALPALVLILTLLASLVMMPAAPAAAASRPNDAAYQTLPFSQAWTDTGLITTNDDWSGVPGIMGYRGDDITGATGTDPQTLLADNSPGVVDVNANQTVPNSFTTGGPTEFHITDPVVALAGSGTADAPYLLLHINTTGFQAITVAYNVRDIESGPDDATQQVALHYRTGGTGGYTNVPAAYVADATTGNAATQVTAVSVVLPAAADNQAMLQLRIMTTNAAGNDEWVGIDDISITGTPMSTDLAPTVTDVTPDDNAVNQPINTPVSVTFSEPVTISSTIAVSCSISGVQNVTPVGGPSTFTLPHTDFAFGDVCTVTISAAQVLDQDGTPTPMAADFSWTFTVTNGCAAPTTPIHTVQGSGSASTLIGQQHDVDGVVVADFQSVSTIRGFYIQEPTADFDADPTTSEGVFIYDNNFGVPVAVGDLVRVTGYVSEFQQQTQISSVSAVTVCGTGTVVPQAITLPFSDTAYPERFEAMSVTLTQTLTVNENYNLGRGGILTLANGRLRQPTNVVAPGAPAIALQAANNLNQVILDDSNLAQNPDPIIYPLPAGLSALNTVRSGDQVSNIAGVFSEGGSGWANTTAYRIHPVSSSPAFTVANPRPVAPDPVRAGGSLRVSSFNVLNFFLTLDTTTGTGPCGPGQNMECRGANTAAEFTRQRDKLLQALYGLNADIVGLMELENTPNVEPLADIVAGLNALAGSGTYAYIATGVINPGDVIKVGLIYKPAVVQPVGDFAILNSLIDPNFDTSRHRPALAQTFQQVSTAGRFTIVVNHLKSKGCTGASGLDTDQGDGQSCFNLTRTTGANALASWIATDPTRTGDPDFLVLGDLNSYAMEDPMVALEDAGYTNLETQFVGVNAYSYVFTAQAGSLDHSMANASLLPQVSGATTWHINADEPSVLDYNVEFKSAGQVVSLYNADPYRTSDHDPLLIGLNLTPVDASILVTKTVGTTPGVCATTSSIQVMPGTTVYYCYAVANTGNLTFYLHDLDDDQLGAIFASLPYTLTPGSSVNTVAAGLTISATIDADTTNTALWSAYNPGPTDVITATASATVTLLPPNIVVDPLAIALKLFPDGSITRPLTITNSGGADLIWQIEEELSVVVAATASGSVLRAASAAETGSRGSAGDASSPLAYQSPADFSEGFSDISLLPGQGWFFQNNSSPLGLVDWFQGNTTVFSAQAGAANSYIAANFNNTSGANTISNWMLTPQLAMSNGDTLSFWTRVPTDSIYPDRLQVRLSMAGASTNVGSGVNAVGDFTTLLLDINPTLVVGGYPETWTQYTVTLSGLPSGVTNGRIAWRYFVTDGGPGGDNSNYIGIDTVEYTSAVVTPCSALSDIPWVSVSPISGTMASGISTPVTVSFNAAGLTPGMYTGNLCISSNDPDAGPGNETGMVIVPLTLTISAPTAVTLAGLRAVPTQSLPAGLPAMALPVLASLVLGAAYVARRKQ